MRSYENLPGPVRRAIAAVLQLIMFGLMIAGKAATFWGGVVGGLMIAVMLQEWVIYLSHGKTEQN